MSRRSPSFILDDPYELGRPFDRLIIQEEAGRYLQSLGCDVGPTNGELYAGSYWCPRWLVALRWEVFNLGYGEHIITQASALVERDREFASALLAVLAIRTSGPAIGEFVRAAYDETQAACARADA